ncbi:MAG: DUF2207 domain-containing protein [Candidatus Dojkabacteria bacterium]|nr:DUF2207 domain-containing protein [Candidatus Dojkabacteria bacterium]
MKKYLLLAVFFLCSVFVAPLSAQELNYEHISQFNSDITINQDATIDVTEEIHYYFDTYKHGIFWELPIEYSVGGFKRATAFNLNNLYYYPEGQPELSKGLYERTSGMGWVELKVGDPDTTIMGPYVFVVDYTLQDAGISYFDTHDEVYLNVIGPGWEVPILKANTMISTFGESTDSICYTGEEGSTTQNCQFAKTDNGYTLETTARLEPFEAFTFALKFPPDSIEDRSAQIWLGIIISNLGILLPIPVTIILLSMLKKKWKNREITIIPHYEVPDDLDPLTGGYVYQLKQEFKHISATIIWLATKGHLSIEKEGKKTFLKKEVEHIQKGPSHIEDLFNSLFEKDDKVKIGKMPSSFTNKVQSIFSSAKSSSSEYIDTKRVTTKSLLSMLGLFTAGGGFFFLLPLLTAFAAAGTAIGVGISGIAIAIIASKIDIRSKEGNELYYELKGLRMYIDTAEKHRIEFHNDPEKFRGVFETLLPYAMIFGLEKKWAKEFEDLYKDTQPDWYRGDFNAFDAYMLNKSLNALNSGIKSATTKAYGSSSGYRSSGWSSGGSGFSGGSSGGGGGGSGGGSW